MTVMDSELVTPVYNTVQWKKQEKPNETLEYRNEKEIVTANIQDGRTIASLASEYGISTASINNWIRNYRKEFQQHLKQWVN